MATSNIPIHSNQLPRVSSVHGVAVREDSVYTTHKGKESKSVRHRADKAIGKLQDILTKVLGPDEAVHYVCPVQAPASWFEQWTFGIVIYYITSSVLVFTNRRLLHFFVRRDGSWKRSLRAVRWADVQTARVKGWLSRILRIEYRNGKKETFWRIQGKDAKKMKLLLAALLPVSAGEASATRGVLSLCPNCLAELNPGAYQCSHCSLAFKDEKTMIRRSWVLPGGGYFYTGHPWLGIADFLVEAYLSILVLAYLAVGAGLFGDPLVEAGEEPAAGVVAWVAAASFGIVLAIEKWLTVHHCRRFIREFIPTE